jgi:hypothetical protein
MSAMPLLTNLLSAAKLVIPLIAGAGGEKLLAAGQSIASALRGVKHLYDEATQREIDVTQGELEATITRVNAHAQHTIESLGGEG